mmetsp:Transcript_21804/g.60564  ORF Transcript_21804/g.60564 Transcript_21804/m.60564 type:complete len:368 (+) Transcript_21804:645-1748(+)|eukprot:CAMPEP_0172379264 /NCGR_PEP_ID=MMETSP1060-20121228/69844_1 /TAXON_ID=37318 /ORGANISM="Pseudo-nitzschia pungens, Strain cf. cingulata" /LENGTH=367 /DNA_ID=CAMNT_0013107001 /DNA_START=459 /DNA_END=1562 /DNA_ORIENTATION=-
MSFEEKEISLLPLAGCRKPKIGDRNSNIDGDDDTVEGRSSGGRHDSCVLLKDDCFYDFVNPIDMDVIVDHPTCNSVPSTPIGHCGSHVLGHARQCAIAPGSCADPDSWVRPSQSMSQYVNVNFGCTILQDLNYRNENHDYQEGGALTRYTGCKGGAMEADALDVEASVTSDGAICVATVAECLELVGESDDDNAASFEIDLVHKECDCSKTRIGACFRMKDALDPSANANANVLDRYFCAIEPEVCDEELGLTYQSVDQLLRYSDIDCRLCDARSVIDYKVAVSKLHPLESKNAVVFGILFGSAIGAVIFLKLLHSGFLLLRGKNSSAVAVAEELSAAELAGADADASVVDLDADTEDVKVHEAEFS